MNIKFCQYSGRIFFFEDVARTEEIEYAINIYIVAIDLDRNVDPEPNLLDYILLSMELKVYTSVV